jgi:O-6-methylguanine DNA methyltransferase
VNHDDRSPLPANDDAPGSLASLAGTAPAGLADDVLVEVGLVDRIAPLHSPIGTLWVAWNGRGVSEVDLADDVLAAAARHAARVGRRTLPAPSLPDALAEAIARRLAGERRVRLPLDLRGRTEFEVAVWAKAMEIPRGEVRPYGWIAVEIGRPRAVRAVGTALGHNPVPLIVPCHRVVRTDGTIGEYSLGGPANKWTILAAEGLDPVVLEDAARRGERLLGSATTRIVCWPTCRHARRIQTRNRVPFRTLRDAVVAGYRSCRACRPRAIAAGATGAAGAAGPASA